MTLVLSLLTQDAVLQVSDRRLVNVNTGRLADDDTNKAVVFCGRIAFAYTGLAKLGRPLERTDLWLARVLSDAPGQVEALQALTTAATDEFARLRLPRSVKRHAFVGVGWARFPPAHETFEPYLACVSNFESDHGAWLAESQPAFVGRVTRLGPVARSLLHIAGQRLPSEDRRALERNIERVVSHGAGPRELARLLIEQMRRIAANNGAVGPSLLLNSLPRASISAGQSEYTMIASGPMEDSQTFLYVAADGDTEIQYGPTSTCGGMTTSGFEARPL